MTGHDLDYYDGMFEVPGSRLREMTETIADLRVRLAAAEQERDDIFGEALRYKRLRIEEKSRADRAEAALAAVREIADEYRGDHVVNAAAVVREIDAALAAAEQDEPEHNGYDTYVEQLEKTNPELAAQAREVLADKLTEPKREQGETCASHTRETAPCRCVLPRGHAGLHRCGCFNDPPEPKREQS